MAQALATPAHKEHMTDFSRAVKEVDLGQIDSSQKDWNCRSLGTLEDTVDLCFPRHLLPKLRSRPFPDNSVSECGTSLGQNLQGFDEWVSHRLEETSRDTVDARSFIGGHIAQGCSDHFFTDSGGTLNFHCLSERRSSLGNGPRREELVVESCGLLLEGLCGRQAWSSLEFGDLW
ncbi:hypothetical protein GB937_010826 [Aspergillus fischeri]|nr:hypothetical protein GB937_010826 [Aspergillus fischeri]